MLKSSGPTRLSGLFVLNSHVTDDVEQILPNSRPGFSPSIVGRAMPNASVGSGFVVILLFDFFL